MLQLLLAELQGIYKLKDNIKIKLKETGCHYVGCVHLEQDLNQWWVSSEYG
jgi:hypothetical protein